MYNIRVGITSIKHGVCLRFNLNSYCLYYLVYQMAEQTPISIDMKGFFTSYKRAYSDAHKLTHVELLPPYSPDEISHIQLPNDFRHYLLNVSRELIAGASPTGPILDLSENTLYNGSFDTKSADYSGCLRIGEHIPNECFHVIVTDRYHADFGAVYLIVPKRNTKLKAWKDFTTYITGFILKISESLSAQTPTKS